MNRLGVLRPGGGKRLRQLGGQCLPGCDREPERLIFLDRQLHHNRLVSRIGDLQRLGGRTAPTHGFAALGQHPVDPGFEHRNGMGKGQHQPLAPGWCPQGKAQPLPSRPAAPFPPVERFEAEVLDAR